MSDTPPNDRSKQIRHLRELIAALERRVPQIERVGEVTIARDAEALKLKRLAEQRACKVCGHRVGMTSVAPICVMRWRPESLDAIGSKPHVQYETVMGGD